MRGARAKQSKRLVIDASVGRAAGGPGATAPLSVCCRDFLQAVLELCHRAVMPKALLDEWKAHRSMFASTWLKAMFARKKVLLESISSGGELGERIGGAARSPRELEALQKDIHLVLGALENDRAVVSLDNQMRDILRRVSGVVGEVQGVHWVHPGELNEEALEWLKGSCPERKDWQLRQGRGERPVGVRR